ncbi:hypothetical protein MNBD_PLANCTO02-2594 [hydrothermal vent metagenome]|uniref:Bacterial type II secretion system protein E domain-containing protein n=1 Tax=hydrothermal vent metagenome TaxID=652676 RepID=A0A3B1E909_9ZZZZ
MALFRKKKKRDDDDDEDDIPRNKRRGRDDDDDDDDDNDKDDEDKKNADLVMFGGSTNGVEANLSKNARLAEAGLVPAKHFVTDAITRRAERFRIDPKGKVSSVRMYIDGLRYDGGRMPGRESLAIIQMLKLLAGLDIKEKKIKQSGGVFAEFEKVKYILSVESAPTKSGAESISIRVTDLTNRPEKPEELGFPETIQEVIQGYSGGRKGVLIACGPPGSGTTSTRFGILRTIDAFIYSVFSIANTEHRDTTIITPYDTSNDDDFEMSVAKLKRIEADVLLLDPLTDAQVAKNLFQQHNQLCYVTEITDADSAAGIMKLIEWVEDPKMVGEGIDAILSQKLIRALCDKCKDAFRPSPKLIDKVGLPLETRVLYRALKPPTEFDDEEEEDDDEEEYVPCEKCHGVGFYGRTAMYEMIEMTDSMKELILSDSVDANAIRKQARKEGMVTFAKEAIRLVAEGKTSLEEVQKTFRKK